MPRKDRLLWLSLFRCRSIHLIIHCIITKIRKYPSCYINSIQITNMKLANHNPYLQKHSSSHHSANDPKSFQTFNHLSSHRFQYYSFSRADEDMNDSHPKWKVQPESSHKEQDSRLSGKHFKTYRSRGEDSRQQRGDKYVSLCLELADIEQKQLIGLLLEELDQNQKSRQTISGLTQSQSALQHQLNTLTATLSQKHKAIQKLCETQSRHLDLIQTMEMKLRYPNFDLDRHYYQKYSQLEKYMGDYICSTNQAQEEYMRRIAQLKRQNRDVKDENEKLCLKVSQLSKIRDVHDLKYSKLHRTMQQLQDLKDKQQKTIHSLKQENGLMAKDIEMLIDNLKSHEQFELDMNKDNRQISSSLQLLREKMNTNFNGSSRDVINCQGFKMGFGFDQSELEGLKVRIGELVEEKDKIIREHNQLMEDYQKLCKRNNEISNQNHNLLTMLQKQKSKTKQKKIPSEKQNQPNSSNFNSNSQPSPNKQHRQGIVSEQDSLQQSGKFKYANLHGIKLQQIKRMAFETQTQQSNNL